MVCRRNGKVISHLAGCISDKDYYAYVVTPRPADLTGNGAMLRADEDRKRFIISLNQEKHYESSNSLCSSSDANE